MRRNEFYNVDSLILTHEKVGIDPLYTSNDWKKHESGSFDELIHSGEDGYLKVMDGGSIPWDYTPCYECHDTKAGTFNRHDQEPENELLFCQFFEYQVR